MDHSPSFCETTRTGRVRLRSAALRTAALSGLGAMALGLAPGLALADGETAPVRTDGQGNSCIEPGYRNLPLDENGFAPGVFCFNNNQAGDATTPRLAAVDASKTAADLEAIEDTSPLSPGTQQGRGSFAYEKLTGNEPIDPFSEDISRASVQVNEAKSRWLTAANAGWGTFANENIVTLSTDSSNPSSHYVEVVSRDGRVAHNATNHRMMTGPMAIPAWYLQNQTHSGDHSILTYDAATGISRSMFYFELDAPAQTYQTIARFGPADTSAPADAKVNYDVAQLSASGPSTSAAPTSDDVKSTQRERMEIPRNARFSLGEGAPAGASIDELTGLVTLPAGLTGTVDVPVDVDYPDVYQFASGGYTLGKPDFGGMNEGDYWLNLRSGTSSVVGMQNEYTQIGVDELRAGEINHAISMTWEDYTRLVSFPAKQGDGSMDPAEFPHAPHAGQRFTLPQDFDVDDWIAKNRPGDEIQRMILTAIKEHGGIITDRNLFVNAFNFESPYSYAPYARQGQNVYQTDPEIKPLMDRFYPYNFPLNDLVWIEHNFAEHPGDDAVRSTDTQDFEYRAEGKEAYLPSHFSSTVYAGQQAALPLSSDRQTGLSPDMAFSWNDFQSETKLPGGTFGENAIGKTFKPAEGQTGTSSAKMVVSGMRTTSGQEIADRELLYHAPEGTRTRGQLDDKSDPVAEGLVYRSWDVTVVPRDQPIAREDRVRIPAGSTQLIDVRANDEARFDASRTAGAPSLTTVHLLDASGAEVESYEDAHGTYALVNGQIQVQTKDVQGFAAPVRYRVDSSEGKTSNVGELQVAVYAGAAPVVDPPVEPPVDPQPSDGGGEDPVEPPVDPPVDPKPVDPSDGGGEDPTDPPIVVVQHDARYADATVQAGARVRVAPPLGADGEALEAGTRFERAATAQGLVQMLQAGDADAVAWASVNEDGSVDLAPSADVVAGDYEVPVRVTYVDGHSEVIDLEVAVTAAAPNSGDPVDPEPSDGGEEPPVVIPGDPQDPEPSDGGDDDPVVIPSDGGDEDPVVIPGEPSDGDDDPIVVIPSEPSDGGDDSETPIPSDPSDQGGDEDPKPVPSDQGGDGDKPTPGVDDGDDDDKPAPSSQTGGAGVLGLLLPTGMLAALGSAWLLVKRLGRRSEI